MKGSVCPVSDEDSGARFPVSDPSLYTCWMCDFVHITYGVPGFPYLKTLPPRVFTLGKDLITAPGTQQAPN